MKAIGTYLKEVENGELQLVMDDLSGETPEQWHRDSLFTSNNYDADKMRTLNLSKEEFAEIGENLLIRLLVLNGKLK